MWDEKQPILFGGDYNPDQWDDATIDEDIFSTYHFIIYIITLLK